MAENFFDRNQSADETKTKSDERELKEQIYEREEKKKQTNKRKTDHLQVMFSIHFREFVAFAFGRVTPSTGGLIINRFAGSIVVLSRLVGRSVGRFIQIQFVPCIQFHRNDETYATDTKKTLFVSRLCVSLVSLLLGAALVRSIPCFSLGASHCPMCCGSLSN